MKAVRDHIDTVIANWKRERPDYDLSPVEIVGRTGRIVQYIDQALEAKFEEFGISRATFDVLATLRRDGAPYRMTQRSLMHRLLRTSGGMSLRIDALEKEGLVTRSKDPEDRRSVLVTLAPRGLRLLEKVIPQHLANENALLKGLSKADRDQLIVILRKWLLSLEEGASNSPQPCRGITVLDARASLKRRRAVGFPDVPGILVHDVEPGSWAEDAGLRRGDLICIVEGNEVRSIAEFRRLMSKSIAHVKRIKVMRGSDLIELMAEKGCPPG